MEIALPGLLSSFVSFQLLSLNIYKLNFIEIHLQISNLEMEIKLHLRFQKEKWFYFSFR